MFACQKNGPDKNGPAGPILDENMVGLDQYGQLNMIQPDQFW